MPNVVMQLYGGNIPDEIFRLRNAECCYAEVWGGDIPDEIFRLWNNERCYNWFALFLLSY